MSKRGKRKKGPAARRATLQEVRALEAEIEQLKKEKKDFSDHIARLIDQFQHIQEQGEVTFDQVERLHTAIKGFNIQD